jgi:hypothetical protein
MIQVSATSVAGSPQPAFAQSITTDPFTEQRTFLQ